MWRMRAGLTEAPGDRPTEREGTAGHAYLLSIPGLQQMLVIQHVLLNSRDLKGKDWR